MIAHTFTADSSYRLVSPRLRGSGTVGAWLISTAPRNTGVTTN
jgi:hypothetical protein